VAIGCLYEVLELKEFPFYDYHQRWQPLPNSFNSVEIPISQNVNYIHFSSIILIPAGPLLYLLPLCYKVFDEKMG
ncbi:MAG: hypothetical protein II603_04135, partial [Muribaculaceae bacterium]|nr:hypothetical protein [Muribaculaceae bacterium]